MSDTKEKPDDIDEGEGDGKSRLDSPRFNEPFKLYIGGVLVYDPNEDEPDDDKKPNRSETKDARTVVREVVERFKP